MGTCAPTQRHGCALEQPAPGCDRFLCRSANEQKSFRVISSLTAAFLRDTAGMSGSKFGRFVPKSSPKAHPLSLLSIRTCDKPLKSQKDGRVAEWFKAPVLKTGVPARVPWVRIPPLPPEPIELVYLFGFLVKYAQSNAPPIFLFAGLIAVVIAMFGAIVSISAKVNKLGSSID